MSNNSDKSKKFFRRSVKIVCQKFIVKFFYHGKSLSEIFLDKVLNFYKLQIV